jgi:hypothetical protein
VVVEVVGEPRHLQRRLHQLTGPQAEDTGRLHVGVLGQGQLLAHVLDPHGELLHVVGQGLGRDGLDGAALDARDLGAAAARAGQRRHGDEHGERPEACTHRLTTRMDPTAYGRVPSW